MKKIKTVLLLSIAAFGFAGSAHAASTDWQNLGGGKARLLASKDPITSKIEGVIEIQLEEGWKTYWRAPGDAGIPPDFDFSASNFVELTDVKFPTPEVVEIPHTYFMGYKGNVRFVFEADSFADNASLNLEMLAGVCEEICIPATASFQLSAEQLNVSDPMATSILDMAQLKMPSVESEAFKVNDVLLQEKNVLIVSVTLPSKTDNATFLLEGPNGWFSGPITSKSGVFTLDLGEDFSANEKWQENYRYTILQGKTAISNKLSTVDF